MSATCMSSRNPATGELLASFETHSPTEVERRIALAKTAFDLHRRSPFSQRAACMNRTAELLEAQKHALARTMTLEMGKPIRASIQEIEKCALACRYYAEQAETFLSPEDVKTSAAKSFINYQPIGPVLAVMPWNFPFWQVFRFVAPTLMAGNVGLLKHASNVPQCALAIEEILRQAGFAEGVFQTLLVGSRAVPAIIADDRVAAVTLTGSVAAGSSVAEHAGKHIKKTVLELGGSDPFIVMPTADLAKAAAVAVQARTINNGQSCIAAKRFIVHESAATEFQQRFIDRMRSLKVGDPTNETTDIGPLATLDVLESLEKQVHQTVDMGARVLLGGRRLSGPGWFYEPTVLTDIPVGSPAHNDELFGPVASLFTVPDIQTALKIANDTPFGLGSCIWTNDRAEQDFFIEQVQSGLAFVNSMVASDPRVPFGGIKKSGYGRELSRHGIQEFVNIKTVMVY